MHETVFVGLIFKLLSIGSIGCWGDEIYPIVWLYVLMIGDDVWKRYALFLIMFVTDARHATCHPGTA